MASANTQFYKGSVMIGQNFYPILPGVTFYCPRNLYIPPIVGNNWQFNFGEGLRVPIVECEFLFRDDSLSGGALTAQFFNDISTTGFLYRSPDVAHDTPEIPGGITFFDGRRAITLNGAKADSFVLSCAKGENISLRARFCGAGLSKVTTTSGSYPGWSSKPLLRFKAVRFNGILQDKVWRFTLSYTNNHNPDLALDGTNFPMAQNAGFMQCGFSFMVQASDADAINTGLFNMDTNNPGGTIQFTLTGGTYPGMTVTLPNVVTDSDDNGALTMPRVMRNYDCTCLGASSQLDPPIVIN